MQDSPWENRQCTGKGIIMAAADIGIDLGTSSILVYTKGKGIVLKEPSVVAYDKDADKVKAIGEEARQMIGRTPGNIMATVAAAGCDFRLYDHREDAETFYTKSNGKKGVSQAKDQHLRAKRRDRSGT